MAAWTENEAGPQCPCGDPTVVKLVGGKAFALCFLHTPEAGAMFELPAEKPADFVGYDPPDEPGERIVDLTRAAELVPPEKEN